jgi:voltage-gated potassium channel
VRDDFRARRLAFSVAVLVALLAGGAIAFRLSLHESWLRSIYRAVITTSLTGLDTNPHGTAALLTSMVLVLGGVAIFAYVAASIAEALLGGLLPEALAEKRRRRAIERLRDHYIICGYGRVGRRIAEEFRHAGVDYVVLDFGDDAVEAARERGDLLIRGNGTDDDDLREAGLDRARGLVASADNDVDNLYITLSARNVRPELLIVARASTADAAAKLGLAGADRVVQPYSAAGRQMANLVLKPQVTAFVDVATSTAGPDLRFEEIEITPACAQGGKSIRELRIREETGAIVIAIRKHDGGFDTTPVPDAVLDDGDVVIAAGTEEELQALEQLFAPRESVAR